MASVAVHLKSGGHFVVKDLTEFNLILPDGHVKHHAAEDFPNLQLTKTSTVVFVGAKTSASLSGSDILFVELKAD